MARTREKRRRKRIDAALALTIEYDQEKIRAATKNISLLGTFIEVNRAIPTGTKLNIKIKLPPKGPGKSGRSREVRSEGVVFRSSPLISLRGERLYGTGIFFRSFRRGSERTLADYIDYVLLREKKAGKIFMFRRKEKLLKRKGGE